MPILQFLKRIDDYLHRFTNSRSVLFEVMNSFGFNCQAPVIDALLLDYPHIRIAITTSGLGDEDLVKEHIIKSGYGQYFIKPQKATWKKWDLVICTDTQGVWYTRNHKTAYLQHGISGSGNYPYDGKTNIHCATERFDYFFASSTSIANRCTQYFPQLDTNTLTRAVGFPLLDQPINHTAKDTNIILNPDKPTLLFTSHWDKHSLLKTCGSEVLDLLSHMENFNILLTAHPFNWDTDEQLFTEKKDWKIFFQSFTSHPNVQFIFDQNITQIMPLADILISDHNSCTLEFSALNKPVLRFNNPHHMFHDDKLTQLINRATYNFSSMKELEFLLANDISATAHQKHREELTKYCYTNTGTASVATAEDIVRICS